MRITEIYLSVQGETRHAGLPCVLVRTTGCDLRCRYCDTAYAFHGGEELSLDEVVARVGALLPPPEAPGEGAPTARPLVLLTGGEPLLQRELPELAARLLALGYRVMVETGGQRDLGALPPGVIRIVDVKTPGSGEVERNHWPNLERLGPDDAVKFVLCDEADYRFAREVIARHGLEAKTEVLLSPAHGQLDPQALVAWMLRDGLRARLNLQIHKYVWGADAKGV